MESICNWKTCSFYKAWAIGHDMIDFQGEKGVYASFCRMTRCVIDECNDPQKGERPNEGDEYWVGLRGTNNRIDHCYFANKKSRRTGVAGVAEC